jgi:iron complex transport system substrate-binding protein
MIKSKSRTAKTLSALVGAALLSFFTMEVAAQEHLPTVMSLDYCADQYVLSLAKRDKIIALSDAAEDQFSYHRARAKGIPKSGSSIAEVVKYGPDIAVQTYSNAARMQEFTKRAGVKLISTTYGRDITTMFENMNMIGGAIGRQEIADTIINDYKARLEKIESGSQSKLTVTYLTPSGFTAGGGTFVDDIIKLSGFETYASKKNYRGWLELPLEDMIIDPPDIIITSFFDSNMENQSRWSLSRHDHILKMMQDIKTIHLPGALMACDGIFLIDAAEQIRAQAKEMGIIE